MARKMRQRMRQKCVCCVARSAPPSQFVMSVRSTIVLNVLTPTLVGPMLFVKYNTDDSWSCCIHTYCFVMQHALQGRCAVHHGLFGGPSPSEGKSRAEVGIVNRKVARRVRAGRAPGKHSPPVLAGSPLCFRKVVAEPAAAVDEPLLSPQAPLMSRYQAHNRRC